MLIYKNDTHKLELALTDKFGDFVSGKTISYYVYKSSDNSLFASGTMTEIGSSGVYEASVLFTSIGQYRIEYITPSKFENLIETIYIREELATQELVKRILGLSQENYRIFNPIYNSQGEMTSGTIKIYPTASDVDTDTNSIAEYSIVAVYNAQNKMTSYKVKRTA
jgi:hypothetical protein